MAGRHRQRVVYATVWRTAMMGCRHGVVRPALGQGQTGSARFSLSMGRLLSGLFFLSYFSAAKKNSTLLQQCQNPKECAVILACHFLKIIGHAAPVCAYGSADRSTCGFLLRGSKTIEQKERQERNVVDDPKGTLAGSRCHRFQTLQKRGHSKEKRPGRQKYKVMAEMKTRRRGARGLFYMRNVQKGVKGA